MYAFAALAWNEGNARSDGHARLLREKIEASLPARTDRFVANGLCVFDIGSRVSQPIAVIKPGTRPPCGAVFGTLFRRAGDSAPSIPVTGIMDPEAAELLSTNGASILTRFWGSYIAFLTIGGKTRIIADPTSGVPCFYTIDQGVLIAFSHLEKCSFLDRSAFSLNLDFVSALLAYDKIQNGETGLNEIGELLGGHRLVLTDGTPAQEMIWDPREIAAQQSRQNPEQAATSLRQTTLYVVRSWASAFKSVRVNLSGGLDSSIVLSCLAGSKEPGQLSAVHHIAGAQDASELQFARRAASQAGVRLIEQQFAPESRLPAPGSHPLTTRPYRQFLSPDLLPMESADGEPGDSAVFTGQGGDHLFLQTKSMLGFADHIQQCGVSRRSSRLMIETARLSGRSVWAVVGAALGALLLPPGPGELIRSISRSRTMISTRAHDHLDVHNCAPEWALSRAGLPAGKFDHVARLAHLYHVRETLDRPVYRDFVHPLISQPLIECCLRIPVYDLCCGGISRGLARDAFKALIPETIRTRTTKGETTSYFMSQVRQNAAIILDTLSKGELVKAGLIPDPELISEAAIEKIGDDPQGRRILIYFAIESWLRQWRSQLGTSASRAI